MLGANSESVKNFHESFYGTPTTEEGRRRRGKRRHPAPKEEPQNEVAVVGIHYRSFDDDSMASFVNSATALVPWNGDAKLLIDRYDVRHLLQDLTGIRRRRARPPSPDATKEELDYERYRDLEGLENPSPPEDVELQNENSSVGYQTVGFDYSNGGELSTQKERVEEAIFCPPFFVPENLRANLPTSMKVHQIMAGTAKYVFEHGGQAEIVLRVKQANNPTFGFLMPDHFHHEYFRFLVDHPEHAGMGPSSQQIAAEAAVAVSIDQAEGGLSLLGTAYGDADEDEDEDADGEVFVGVEEEQVFIPEEVPEIVEPAPKEGSEGNSDSGSTSVKKSTMNEVTAGGAENAINDTGDSGDVSVGSIALKSTSNEAAGEVLIDKMVDPASDVREPSPPGTQASGSEEARGQNAPNLLGDLDHQVPPYREPPIQLRRIIDKMVEFISRNGKEFEAIVRERDKRDGRFPFFVPWNEYYPYYMQALETARQALASGETAAGETVPLSVPVMHEPSSAPMHGDLLEKNQVHDSFLNGVPFWDEAWPVEVNDGIEGATVLDTQDYKTENSHNGEGRMGFEAVLAAVHAATRGRPRAVEESDAGDQMQDPVGSERPEMGSDEAVLAAIRAATGRSKSDASGSVGKGEMVQMTELSGPGAGTAEDPTKTTAGADSNEGSKHSPSPLLSNVEASSSLDGDRVVVVAKAAALAVHEEGDSVEAQLAPSEKRKAERLKRAKLFAAMIKDKNGSLANGGLMSGSAGISGAPSVERPNEATLALETTGVKPGDEGVTDSAVAEPEPRTNQTGEGPIHAVADAEMVGIVDSSFTERTHKSKSTAEQEEKHRKHHHKRKKDREERESESKYTRDSRDKKPDKSHDYYQESKSKERKRHGDLERKRKDKNHDGVTQGKSKEKRRDLDFDDDHEEIEERRHHTSKSEGKRKESKHEYQAEQIKIGTRHRRESEEMRESRHGYGSEERWERRHKYDTDQKRETRHIHDEDKRSGSRHGRDLEETRKRSHSHGKKKKHREIEDHSENEDGRKDEHRSKKSKRYGTDLYDVGEHQQDLKGDNNLSRLKQDLPVKVITGDDEKPVQTPIDVPEDIRAKVRAILAMT